MSVEPIRVRPVRPGDLEDLYRVCLLTADFGEDATRLYSDPKLVGHLYVAPYAIFEPSLAFVAEDTQAWAVTSQPLSTPTRFEQRLKRDWWPGLCARYTEPSAEAADCEETGQASPRRPLRPGPTMRSSVV